MNNNILFFVLNSKSKQMRLYFVITRVTFSFSWLRLQQFLSKKMSSSNLTSNRSTPPPQTTATSGHLRVNKSLIQPLLSQPKRIRNVCILAHVDHGNKNKNKCTG